jgi:hypothetical protein
MAIQKYLANLTSEVGGDDQIDVVSIGSGMVRK